MQNRRSWLSVLIALVVILVGLFMVCSQRQTQQSSSENLSADDEQFRQELLEMLDLAEDMGDENVTELEQAEGETEATEDDVLALLTPEETEPVDTGESEAIDMTPEQETAESMGLSASMFRQVRNDVAQLESVLEERSTAVDSLRRIIERRNVRIQALEQRMVQRRPQPSSRSYQPSRDRVLSRYAGSEFMADYQAARSLFENFQYRQAIQAFQEMLTTYPNHEMADNCQYWIGESYFGMREYQKAIIEFQKVFAYSQTDKYDDAQLMIGLSHLHSGQAERARKEFETFLNTYVDSEYIGIVRRYYQNV